MSSTGGWELSLRQAPSCAYVAMMGWATLRHGGLPTPVLLIALVLAGAPVPPAGLAVAAGGRAGGRRLCGARDGRAAAPAGLRPTARASSPPGWPAPRSCSRSARRSCVGHVGGRRRPAPSARRGAAPRHGPQLPPSGGTSIALGAASSTGHRPRSRAQGAGDAPAPDPAAGRRAPAPRPTPSTGPAARPPTTSSPRPTPPTAAAALRPRLLRRARRAATSPAAWEMLCPAVQRAFGGFARWRKGYAQHGLLRARRGDVTPAGAGATVGLTLPAGDRAPAARRSSAASP